MAGRLASAPKVLYRLQARLADGVIRRAISSIIENVEARRFFYRWGAAW